MERAEAAGVALSGIAEVAASLWSVRLVRLVLHEESALRIHEEALASLVSLIADDQGSRPG